MLTKDGISTRLAEEVGFQALYMTGGELKTDSHIYIYLISNNYMYIYLYSILVIVISEKCDITTQLDDRPHDHSISIYTMS